MRRFLKAVWLREKPSHREGRCLMNPCMAAFYDADPRAPFGFLVLYHLETGERIEPRRRNWLA